MDKTLSIIVYYSIVSSQASQVFLLVKNLPANAGGKKTHVHPWVGKIPWGGHGNPFQYSCLENPMVRGAWQSTIHGVTELDMPEVA